MKIDDMKDHLINAMRVLLVAGLFATLIALSVVRCS
jgi:hypothetical protein